MSWEGFLGSFFAISLPILLRSWPIVLGLFVLLCPLPGRGPRLLQRQDPWRLFKGEPRRIAMARAGGRCESAAFIVVGRCRDEAEEVDHIYPYSRGGPTVLANAQALCKGHNQHKGAMRPPWWYVLLLEQRRRRYFPPELDVRVSGRASAEEFALHISAAKRAVGPTR